MLDAAESGDAVEPHALSRRSNGAAHGGGVQAMHSFLPVKGGGAVSRLSDGDFAVPLSALGAFAAQLGDLLIEEKVGGTDVIAFACAQSVPHALTLLSLLQLGRSVALLPQGVDETDRLRRLCAFEVSPEVDGAGSDLRRKRFCGARRACRRSARAGARNYRR